MYLGIMVLAIAILVVYFESKLREQNHKIASMFSIVSTLAEDNNQLKFAVGHIASGGGVSQENTRPVSINEDNILIPVSDDEESDDDDSEIDDSEIDEDSDSDSDDEEVESDNKEVKVLKISSESVLEEEEQVYDDEFEKLSEASSPIDLGDEPLELLDDQEPDLEQDQDFDATQKSIHINLEEESVDYKKLTLQKLKTIVVEKGLIADSSKLKKPELLKLLGIE